MTINTPVIANGSISFGLSGVDTQLNTWYIFRESDTTGITGNDPTTISGYENLYLPLEVETASTSEFKVRDLPYMSGEFSVFLEDNTGWDRLDFTLPNTKRATGINFPTTLRTSAEKQPTPIVDANDIKGAPKYYGNFNDFLYLPKEHMIPNLTAYVYDSETNTIKQFVLSRNGNDVGNGTFGQLGEADIPNIPYPLLKIDIDDTRSYERFWTLISESKDVAPLSGVIRYYAPDYEDGVPPLHDNLLSTGTPGVTYPVGLAVPSDAAYDKQREFLGVWSWDAPTSQFINADAGTTVYFPTRQVTKTQKPGDKWFVETVDGISFSRWRRIGQFDTGSVRQNRYIRRVTDANDPTGTLTNSDPKFPPTPLTFLEGNRNRFGQYDDDFNQGGTPTRFQYEDIPPAKRNVKASLSANESSMYDDFITDGVTNLDIDGLWEVTCIKDRYNRLESDFETARYIPKDGDLVRYNTNSTPNINDLIEAEWANNGWVEEFDPDIHRYKAERNNTGEDFQIVLISAEIGTYTSRVFKAYPLRYFDDLTNPLTAANYAPQNLAAAINPLDGVDDTFLWDDGTGNVAAPNNGAWVDSWFSPPQGWNLWVSEAVLFFGGDKLKTPWSNPTLFDNEAAVLDVIEGQEDFHSTEVVDDDGISSTTYDPQTIDLVATLYQYDQRESDAGQQYVINDDLNETITYKWERIFNNGAADSTIIFDNTSTAPSGELISAGDLVGGAFTYSPGGTDTYRIEDDGRTLRIYPAGLDKRAIYKVTQERTTAAGTVTYVEETRGLLDVADGLASKTVAVTSDSPYFILKGDAIASGGQWQFDDYTNPKAGTNHPEIVLRAFIQNVAAGNWYRWSSGEDFDTVRNDVLSGSITKENTISATYWTQVASTQQFVLAADAIPWNDDTVNKQIIYKYHVGSAGSPFYDTLRIERIQEGADIKDLDLRTNSQVVSYNGGETDYDPAAQTLEFRAVHQNLSAAGINWEVLDNTGSDISGQVILYDQVTGGSPVTDGDTVGYLRTADHPAGTPWRYNNLINNLPFTVKITHDDDADQLDFITVRKISNGAEGPAGIDALVGFLDNEAEVQTCNEQGVPINAANQSINGTLQIKSTLVVYSGTNVITSSYQFGGTIPTNDISAVDENGAALTKGTGTSEYDYVLSNNNRTITVTRIPEDVQKVIISLPIQRTSDQNLLITKTLTIGKALAGISPLRVILDNEQVIGKYQPDGTLLDVSASGRTGYSLVGSVNIKGFIADVEQTIVFNGDSNDTIVGYEGAVVDAFNSDWPSPAALGETTARSNRYTTGGHDMYIVLGDSGNLYFVTADGVAPPAGFDYTIQFRSGGLETTKKIAMRWIEQPNDLYQVEVYSADPAFSANEAPTATTVVSARLIDKTGATITTLPTGWTLTFSLGTATTTEAGYAQSVSLTRSQINISNMVVVTLRDAGSNVVSVGTITIYDLKDAPSFQELFYSSNSATFPSRPTGTYASFPNSTDGQWGKTQDVDRTYLYVSRKSEYDTEWGWPVQVKGEEGVQGIFSVPVRVYRVDDHKPPAPTGGTVPNNGAAYNTFVEPSGWTKEPLYQGIKRLWSATRFLESDNGVWSWNGDWIVDLVGASESLSEVYVYRGASTATPSWVNDYDSPANEYPQTAGDWKNTIRDVASSAHIFRAKGLYAAGALQQRVVTTGVQVVELNAVTRTLISGSNYRFFDSDGNIITLGSTGDAYFFQNDATLDLYIKQATNNYWQIDNSQRYWWSQPEEIYTALTGPQGPKGDTPDHEWSGTQLRFELPDGNWGSYVDLQGPQGIQGPAPSKVDSDPIVLSPLAQGVPPVTVESQNQLGFFIDFGDIVFYSFRLQFRYTGGTPATNEPVEFGASGGFPTANGDFGNSGIYGKAWLDQSSFGDNHIYSQVFPGTTNIQLVYGDRDIGGTVTWNTFNVNQWYNLRMSGFYFK